MTRIPFKTSLAAVVLLTGAGLTPATAADFGGNDRGYSGYERSYSGRDYGRDSGRDYSQDTRRRVPDNFDEDGDGYRPHNGSGHGQHNIQRIEARASYASDYLPFHVKEWRARRSAIETWKSKVANRYGEQFAHWRQAEGKQVNCDAAAGSVYCTVSARPKRGWSQWGWNANW